MPKATPSTTTPNTGSAPLDFAWRRHIANANEAMTDAAAAKAKADEIRRGRAA